VTDVCEEKLAVAGLVGVCWPLAPSWYAPSAQSSLSFTWKLPAQGQAQRSAACSVVRG
jgi:hypothetical protein